MTSLMILFDLPVATDQGPIRSSIRTGDQRRAHWSQAAEGQVKPVKGPIFVEFLFKLY